MGKSALAARFTELHAEQFSLVWWMIADSSTAIDTGLAELAMAVAPQTAELPTEQRTKLGVRWLATHMGWLLVLDNLTSPQDAAELLARMRTGTVVITSRQRTGWHAVAETVPLDVLRPDEAIDLMTRIICADQPEADLTVWIEYAPSWGGCRWRSSRRQPASPRPESPLLPTLTC